MDNEYLLDKSGGRCWYCGCVLDTTTKDKPDSFCVEHVIPRFYGGRSTKNNLVPACRACNCMKRTKTLEQFRTRMMLEINGIPYFSDTQITWLRENGFTFSDYKQYEFYFETLGCQP